IFGRAERSIVAHWCVRHLVLLERLSHHVLARHLRANRARSRPTVRSTNGRTRSRIVWPFATSSSTEADREPYAPRRAQRSARLASAASRSTYAFASLAASGTLPSATDSRAWWS